MLSSARSHVGFTHDLYRLNLPVQAHQLIGIEQAVNDGDAVINDGKVHHKMQLFAFPKEQHFGY